MLGVCRGVCDEMEDFCRRLPKIELHAHLNGSISDGVIERLVARHTELGWAATSPLPDNWQVVIEKGSSRSIDECFLIFMLIHQLTRDETCIQMVAESVIRDFAADNCCYLELRSTPRAVAGTGMTKESYVGAMLKGLQSCQESGVACSTRLILSIDRRQSAEDAMDTVLLAHKHQQRSGLVVGVDLSGDPRAGNAADFLPALRHAKSLGLKLAVHAAEIPDIEGTRVLLSAGIDRLGHGTCLHTDHGGHQDLVDTVAKERCPIEVCLSSNIKTRTVSSYADHHFAFWYSREHPLCFCTDDKGVFATTLSEEYVHAAEAFQLSQSQLQALSLSSVEMTFAGDEVKERLRKTIADFR